MRIIRTHNNEILNIFLPYVYSIHRVEASTLSNKIIGFILEYVVSCTLPFFLAHICYLIFIENGLINSYNLYLEVLLFIFGYIILFPIYEIGYLVNDVFSIKLEDPDYRTTRVSVDISNIYVFVMVTIRLLLFLCLIYLVKNFSVLNIDVYKILSLSILILIVFFIHDLSKPIIRLYTTFPMLRFLRNTFILSQIIHSQFEWTIFTIFMFAYIVSNSVHHVIKKTKKEYIFKDYISVNHTNSNLRGLREKIVLYNISIALNFNILLFVYFSMITYFKNIFKIYLFGVFILMYYIVITFIVIIYLSIKVKI